MAEFNLKSPHVSCLYYLYKEGPLTAKELCDICDEDKAAISRSIVYLERDGYITCLTDAHKRYKSPQKLTAKGEEAGKRVADKIDGIINKAGEGLSEEDRTIFYRSLGMINDNLQEICKNYSVNKYHS